MFPGLESDSGSLISIMTACLYDHMCMYMPVSMLYMPVYVCIIAVYLCICTYVHVLLVDREKNG